MVHQVPTQQTAFRRELALGSLLFFLPLLLLIVPQVGQAAGWQVTNLQGRAITQFAAAPAEGLVLYYAATSTNGLQRSSISTSNGSAAFEMWHEADAGLPGRSLWEVPVVHHLAVNPNNGRELIVLVENDDQASLYHSNDGGATWQLVRGNLDREAASTIALTPDGAMAVANGYRLLWRAGRGEGWIETPAWPASAGQARSILAVEASPSQAAIRPAQRVLVVTTAGKLLTLDNVSGANWRERLIGPASRVDLLASAADRLYAATDRGIYRSEDAGVTWYSAGILPTAAPVLAMVVDPANTDVVYAAVAGDGIVASRDGGATWERIGRGLENQHLHALVIDPRTPRQLLVATDAGVWRHVLSANE